MARNAATVDDPLRSGSPESERRSPPLVEPLDGRESTVRASQRPVAEGDSTFRVTREGRVEVSLRELLRSQEVSAMSSTARRIVRVAGRRRD